MRKVLCCLHVYFLFLDGPCKADIVPVLCTSASSGPASKSKRLLIGRHGDIACFRTCANVQPIIPLPERVAEVTDFSDLRRLTEYARPSTNGAPHCNFAAASKQKQTCHLHFGSFLPNRIAKQRHS